MNCQSIHNASNQLYSLVQLSYINILNIVHASSYGSFPPDHVR